MRLSRSQAEDLGTLTGYIVVAIMILVFFDAWQSDIARIEAEAEQVRVDSIAQMGWFDDNFYVAPHWSLPEGKGFILKGSGTGRGIYDWNDTTIIITEEDPCP